MVDTGQNIIENARPIRWGFVSSRRRLLVALSVSTFRLSVKNTYLV